MKFLTTALVLFIGLSATAQQALLDPARQAERNAVYGPGYVTPGNAGYYQPGRPGRPGGPGRPPMPPPPPRYPPVAPPPAFGDVGQQYTVRWQDNGVTQLQKVLTTNVSVWVGGNLTNEVLVRAIDNTVQIQSAIARLSNGRIVDLRNLTGALRNGQEARSLLDSRYSLRVQSIEIVATSASLIGSRAQVQVLVGLAQ